MQYPFKDTDKEKTIAEHTLIILNYKKTGLLDRENAIAKFKDFNTKYPDYNISQTTVNIMKNTLIHIESATDDVIAGNLYSQLSWLVDSEYLKTLGI